MNRLAVRKPDLLHACGSSGFPISAVQLTSHRGNRCPDAVTLFTGVLQLIRFRLYRRTAYSLDESAGMTNQVEFAVLAFDNGRVC